MSPITVSKAIEAKRLMASGMSRAGACRSVDLSEPSFHKYEILYGDVHGGTSAFADSIRQRKASFERVHTVARQIDEVVISQKRQIEEVVKGHKTLAEICLDYGVTEAELNDYKRHCTPKEADPISPEPKKPATWMVL